MCLQQVQRIQGVHEHQENQQYHGHQLYRPCQGVHGVQKVPEEIKYNRENRLIYMIY